MRMKIIIKQVILVSLLIGIVSGPIAIRAEQAAHDNNIWWNGIFHYQDGIYMSPLFPSIKDGVTLVLRVNKDDLTGAKIRYWNGSEFFVDMVWDRNDDQYGYWKGTIPASATQVYYKFMLVDGSDMDWYNAKGMSDDKPLEGDFTYFPIGGTSGFKTPDWVRNAVFYQIFPERFYNADSANDPPGTVKWGSEPTTKNFMGGDLKGILDKLKYLNDGDPKTTDDLGITAIYLNPVFESRTNHKYSTEDYEKVDDNLGDNQLLSTLIKEAHGRGIRIILDGVFNHTGVAHPFFDDVVKRGEASPYYKLYTIYRWPIRWYDDLNNNGNKDSSESYFDHWSKTQNDEYLRTGDYDAWWGFAHLPNLITTNESIRDYFITGDNAICVRWINLGIDGWRLDVANEIEDDFWKIFRTKVKEANPDAYIVGEYWGNAAKWLDGTMWDSTMNYRFRAAVQNFFAGIDDDGNPSQTSVDEFDKALYEIKSGYPEPAYSTALNLLGSHDTWRFIDRCGGDWTKLRAAVIFQMTYPGAPMIYYGDENGMSQWPGANKDPGNRSAMEWEDYSHPKRAEINELYRKLIKIRLSHDALRSPHIRTIYKHKGNKVYAYARRSSDETVIVVINNSSSPKDATIKLYGLIPEGTNLFDEIHGNTCAVKSDQITVSNVDARDGVILAVKKADDYSALKINEFMPAPSAPNREFIELYNTGTSTIDLSGFKVDNVLNAGRSPKKIPKGTTIKPKDFYLIKMYAYLKNTGDTVNLIDPNGKVIDSYIYSKNPGKNKSIGRYPDGSDIWGTLLKPTPGASNSGSKNVSPTASFIYAPLKPKVSEKIQFDASDSTDSDGNIVEYKWDWKSDGTYDAPGKKASHAYTEPGSYEITLAVIDNSGAENIVTRNVFVVSENGSLKEFYGTTNGFAGENIYFVITDRFVNGNTENDHRDQGRASSYPTWELKMTGDGGQYANIGYMGGDFEGIYENAGYIKDMGFTSIWITPIVDNPDEAFTGGQPCSYGAGIGSDGGKTGYHGYWGVNFYRVDEHYESNGFTFAEFTTKMLHDHGLKIILDIVCNHASPSFTMPNDQPKFGEIYDKNGTLVADHQNLPPANLDYNNPLHRFYNRGGGLAQLSDLREENPDVLAYLAGAYLQWIDQGAYAFRIDTIAWMPHSFWKQFADRIRQNHPDFFMFGENFNYNAGAIAQHQKPENGNISVLDFPGKAAISSVFSGGGSYASLEGYLHLTDGTYTIPYELVTFYDNHDMARMNANENGFIDAHNWLFTTRGIPCIYYGSEKRFMAGKSEHQGNRNYYGELNISEARAGTVYQRLRKIAHVRRKSPALQKGLQVNISLGSNTASLYRVFQHNGVNQTALVLLNKGDSPASFKMTKYMSNGTWTDADSGESYNVTSNELSTSVPPHDVRVFLFNDPVNNGEFISLLTGLMNISGEKVEIDPNPAKPGSDVKVSYRATAEQQIECHWGINNWSGTGTPQGDIPMSWNPEEFVYECMIPVPAQATKLDMVFHNITMNSWDNNNGADWHFKVE
ncbi:MAG: alpha amylase N-terminal ig-like domain-containing protein [bacterium]